MNVIIVDDHPVARYGLKSILSRGEDCKVVGEAGNVDEAIKVISDCLADIVLVDMELKKENGLNIIRKCRENQNNCKFIMLAETNDQEMLLSATAEGVHGYLLKEALPEEILKALRLVALGQRYFYPKLFE